LGGHAGAHDEVEDSHKSLVYVQEDAASGADDGESASVSASSTDDAR
jgi:hypothetical protein